MSIKRRRELRKQFDCLGGFSPEGLADAEKDGQFFHIREDGSRAYKVNFDFALGFSEGLAGVEKDGEFFHILPNGKPAYSVRFDDVSNFSNGKAWIRKGGKWAQIDKDGKLVSEWFDSIDV